MILDFLPIPQFARGRALQLIMLSSLLLMALAVIPTPFAVSGQQNEVLINQGRRLARITPGGEGSEVFAGTPLRSPIHQVVAGSGETTYVACQSGLYAWSRRSGWTQLYPGAVMTVAEAGSTLFLGARRQLLSSGDRGRSWQATGGGLPEEAVPLIIRVAPSDDHVIYLGTAQHGVYRSLDRGRRFESLNQGLPRSVGAAPVTPIAHLAIDPQAADTVYVSTEFNGLYKTSDGGQDWTRLTTGLPGPFSRPTYPPLLAVHPDQADTVYTVIGFPVHSQWIENKIYKTTDGGAHWVAIKKLPDNTIFESLTVLPGETPELVVGGNDALIRFTDRGQQIDGARYRNPPPLRPSLSLNADFGNIAVIEDDGTLNQNFDLHGRTIECVPTRAPGYMLSEIAASFETELGPQIPLGDNDSVEIGLPFEFQFFATEFSSLFVNANGNLTFGAGDDDPRPLTRLSFFQFRLGPPKIAAFWEDYDPSSQGSVHVKTASDPERLVVTWNNVARVDSLLPDSNTFQVALLADGRVRISLSRSITNQTGLVGLSPGGMTTSARVVNLSRDLPQTVDNRPLLEFFSGNGLDFQALAKKFYETHEDIYDQLVTFGSGLFQGLLTGQLPALAFNVPVNNEIQGLGRPPIDISASFGSQGRLQSFLNMNRLNFYPSELNRRVPVQPILTSLGVLGHETTHRWGMFLRFIDGGIPSFALLSSDLAHWSFFFDSDASVMFGNRWIDNEDGTFTSVESAKRFGVLDQYVMGLRPASSVNPVFYIAEPVDVEGRTRNSLPETGVTVSGRRVDVTIDQILATQGPRSPGFGQSPTSLNQAYILFIPEGTTPIAAEIEKVDLFRRAFEPDYNQMTGRRIVIDTRLSPGQPDLVVENAAINPPLLTPGQTASVSLTIRNQGTAAAGLVANEVRLSADEEVQTAEASLKQIITLSLQPGEATVLTDVPVTLPLTTSAGTKFVSLTTDSGGAARESDETNNQVIIPVTVVGQESVLTPIEEFEPNNRPEQATPITPDAIITATLNPARDADFYVFQAPAGQTVTLDVNTRFLIPSSEANTLVALLDSAGNDLAQNDDFANSPDSFLQFLIPRTGQYFVQVTNVPNSEGGREFVYQLVVMLRSPTAIGESEPNDSLATANQIAPDVIVDALLNAPGDEDFYRFNADRGQILTVDVDAQSLIDSSQADTVLSLFDENGSLLAESDDSGGSPDSFLQVVIPRTGQYFVRLRDAARRGGPGFTYRLKVKLASVQRLETSDSEKPAVTGRQ